MIKIQEHDQNHSENSHDFEAPVSCRPIRMLNSDREKQILDMMNRKLSDEFVETPKHAESNAATMENQMKNQNKNNVVLFLKQRR